MNRVLFVSLGVGILVGTIVSSIPTEDGIAFLAGIIAVALVLIFFPRKPS